MGYTKPGVSVTYVQKTVSPNLNAPDLPAVIVGKAYEIHDIAPDSPFEDDYSFYAYENDDGNIFTLSGYTTAANIDTDSVYVDLIHPNAGSRKHLDSSTDFSTAATGVITINPFLGAGFDGGEIKIGYREQIMTHNNLVSYESNENIEDRIGKVDIYNPLTWGLSWALANAGLTVNGYGINSADETTGHTNAISDLALEEDVYILAPVTNTSTIHGLYQTHCVSMSNPTNKKERILMAGRSITWKEADGTAATGSDDADTDKGQTVSDIAVAAAANGQKRTFWVYPDVLYVRKTMHLSQITRTYMNAMFGGAYGTTSGEYAKLAKNIALESGTTLYAGTLITDTIWDLLQVDSESQAMSYMIDVYVPVPGYYIATATAGQRSGLRPEQPLTNVAIAGPAQVKYASDFFSETNLNTAAAGGTYWMYQKTLEAPIVCRHQLSTDVSSVQKQELSILSALDFTGKFVRNGVSFYIGKYTITPNFLKMLQMVVSAQGQYLVREGYLNSFSIVSMEVNPTSSDTIDCTIEVGVKFPVNYIRFTLVF